MQHGTMGAWFGHDPPAHRRRPQMLTAAWGERGHFDFSRSKSYGSLLAKCLLSCDTLESFVIHLSTDCGLGSPGECLTCLTCPGMDSSRDPERALMPLYSVPLGWGLLCGLKGDFPGMTGLLG